MKASIFNKPKKVTQMLSGTPNLDTDLLINYVLLHSREHKSVEPDIAKACGVQHCYMQHQQIRLIDLRGFVKPH